MEAEQPHQGDRRRPPQPGPEHDCCAQRISAPSPGPMNCGRIAAKKSNAFGLVAFVTNPRT